MKLPHLDILTAMLDGPFVPPSPLDVRQARQAAGLSQDQAAFLAKSSKPSWYCWENGYRMMSLPTWNLFLLKTRQDWRDFSRDGYPGWKAAKGKG